MPDEDQDLSTPAQTQLYAHDRQPDSYGITRSRPVALHGIISFTPVTWHQQIQILLLVSN